MNDEEKDETRITKAVLFVEHLENHINAMGLKYVKCKICKQEDAEIRIEDDEFKLRLCWECYNQDYGNENIDWVYL